MSKPSEFPPPLELTFVSHLIEIRDRLVRSVIVVAVIFLSLFYFANDLYTFVANPLLAHMPAGSSMIATEVASPFLTPFKLTLMLSIFVSVPFLLYQVWAFIAPALYKQEKRLVFPLVVSSTILFYAGMTFCYYVVFPLVFAFLTAAAPEGVAVMTDIGKYLDFVLAMFFAFGIAFEVPIATILLVWSGLTTVQSLRDKRRYIIVGAFIVGMILTPPDVFSQTLLAIPMWLLFEVGLLAARFYTPEYREQAAAKAAQQSESKAVATQTPDAGKRASSKDRFEAYDFAAEKKRQQEQHAEYEPLPRDDENTIGQDQPGGK